ncbi:MAG: galactokinase [Bacteroidota bacterium]
MSSTPWTSRSNMATALPQSFLDRLPEGNWTFFVRSPGRINIIGEHLDYNGGYVLPAAIDRAIYFAVEKGEGTNIRCHALDIDERATFDPLADQPTGKRWVDYLLGICRQFRLFGYEIPAFNIAFGGDLPIGGGLSSSAALEGGMAFLLNDFFGRPLDRLQLATMCQRSSNDFLDIPTGIMDQFASLHGRAGKALLLDTLSLNYEEIAIDIPDYSFILINSQVEHELPESGYKDRVRECKMALNTIQEKFPEIKHLAFNSPGKIKAVYHLSPHLQDRALYLCGEQARVEYTAKNLKESHGSSVGKFLNDSHEGQRDLYEVSCPEIDFLQSFAQWHPDVAGSRLMGGGFGGCTLNLVHDSYVEGFVEDVKRLYLRKYKIEATAIPVKIADGTEVIQA